MAKLSDINASHAELISPHAKQGKDISGLVTFDSKNPPKENKEWIIFKLVTSSNQGGVYLPSIDDVINPATGQIERIRLLSGVDTIWLKEQKEVTKEYAERNLREIAFPRGVKIRRVRKIDKTMVDFLRITNANIGNIHRVGGSRFEIYEYDTAAADKEAFDKDTFEIEMAIVAKEAKQPDMIKHAAFLGVSMINSVTGEPKSPDGIRREYVVAAKRDPLYFQKTLKSTQIEIAWMVKKSIGESLIEIGREPGKIYWANGGGMIGVYPQGENAEKYLVDLAMTNNEEGKRFKEQLQKVVT